MVIKDNVQGCSVLDWGNQRLRGSPALCDIQFTWGDSGSHIVRAMNYDAVAVKTANYTMGEGDFLVIGNTSGGTFTVTLPTAVGKLGRLYKVKQTGGATSLTVGTTSSQTIDGSTTATLTTNQAIEVISDGSNWVVL